MRKGKYRHYKGNLYEVLAVARHTETGEKMVVYRALYDCPDLLDEYGPDPLFVRPHAMFIENIKYKDVEQPRFRYVGDD